MTYITTTILNLEKEPDAYHTKEEGFEYYSVHISYEINPTNGCDETSIKEQYFTWLDKLSNLKFYVFSENDLNEYINSQQEVKVIYPVENDTTCDKNQIENWIVKNIGNIASSRKNDQYELEISDNDKPVLTIADLLKSSAQWPAPLPQNSCFKKIVKIPKNIASNSILVAFHQSTKDLPILMEIQKDEAEQEKDKIEQNSQKDDRRKIPSNETTYWFVSKSDSNERFYTEKINKVNITYPVTLSKENGFFILGEEQHQDYLVLRLINERSPQALNTLEALLDLKEADLDLYEPTNNLAKIERFKAYTEACVISIFDSLSISLLMPSFSDLNGTLLSSFKNILLNLDKENQINWKDNDPIANFRSKYQENFNSVSTLLNYLPLEENSLIRFIVNNDQKAIEKKLNSGELKFNKLKEEFVKLSADIHDESAFEGCICKIFEAVIKQTQNGEPIFDKGLSEFKTLLNGPYNAVDAVRFDVAKVFSKVLTYQEKKEAEEVHKYNSVRDTFSERLNSSNYFYWRYNSNAIPETEPKLFRDLIKAIPKCDSFKGVINENGKTKLKQKLEMFSSLINDQLNKSGKFLPDTNPLPLPIRVAVDPYDDDMSKFQEQWAGIGIMINRANEGWKHACIGNLKIDSSEVQNSLVPISLAQQDGAYESYLEYHGFTLINKNQSIASTLEPYYTITESSAFQVPKLVYGMNYQIAAFAVTMGGVLPKQVRRGNGNDKLCIPINIGEIDIPKENTYSTKYLRTTAIGKVDIAHFPNSNESERRINKSYPAVDPLNQDEPRLSICASIDFGQHLDLYRNIDGLGIIDIDKSKVITINQLKVHGVEPVMLSLAIGSGNKLLQSKPTQIQHETKSLKIGFKNVKGVDVYFEGLNSGEKYWVQLSINSRQESNVAISFAKPDYLANIDNLTEDKSANLLLIAKENEFKENEFKKNEAQWRAPFNKPFFAQITLSRVSFLDFEHWFPLDGEVNTNLLNALNYGMELRKIGAKLANLKVLDILPDPAVTGFLLTLSPINSIIENQVATPQDLYIPRSLENFFKDNPPKNISDSGSLDTFLKKLNRYFTLTLNVECKDGNDLNKPSLTKNEDVPDELKIHVLEGLIAKLTIQPVVTVDTMNQKFAERMEELKIGEGDFDSKNCWIMPGESLTIEAMYFDPLDINQDLSKEIKISVPQKQTRKYQLTLENINEFRRFKSVEIESQRWRHSGIAQYQWLKPTKQDSDVFTESEIKDFEDELFVERENNYDGYKTKLGLSHSLLQEFQWEQPSATWFRHRVKFYSRYQGALAITGRAFTINKDEWTHRAGVLAKPTQNRLPTPQLRALIPLPLHPDGIDVEKGVPSPPILCIDEEPPCPFGLADRFVALIENGLSYVFEGKEELGKVKPIDFRKEIGPDPRQSYTPFLNDSVAVLDVEGPFGLHFEKIETAGANWVNSQFFIHPRMLNGNPIQSETFIGIRLLRILDPDWVVSKNISEGQNEFKFSIEQNVWIEGLNNTLKVCVNSENILSINDNKFVVGKRFIDSASVNGTLDLISLEKIDLSSIKVLHQPISRNAGRFIIFESIETGADIGVSNNLRPITYFEWKMPESTESSLDIKVSGCKKIREAFASDLTPMQWTRTSYNKNILYALKNKQSELISNSYLANKLSAIVTNKKLIFKDSNNPIWLYPSIQHPNFPQKIHSRYFVVLTEHTKDKGAPVEIFNSAKLLAGNEISIEKPENIKNVRVGLLQLPCKNMASDHVSCSESLKKVYFDLIAHKQQDEIRALMFHFTFRHNQKFDDLNNMTLNFSPFPDGGQKYQITLKKESIENLLSIDVWLIGRQAYCKTIDTDGNFKDLKLDNISIEYTKNQGIYVSMSAEFEVWANVSMLVGKKIDETNQIDNFDFYNFDFDWIFSNDNTELPSIATSKDSLKNMLEPTAQIVSISAPIIVLNNGN